jgi:nondiscriminating glutamyl-tRNA synthetase
MESPEHIQPDPPRENLFSAEDVRKILNERGWLSGDPSLEQLAFCERAAALLGPQAADSNELAELLHLIFHYDAAATLQTVEAHAVLARTGAREVVRQLALFLLDEVPFDSERLKVVVTLLKEKFDLRSRDLFHPLRLALAGRSGDGELDRVVLLLDEAAAVAFAVPVKRARARILEFCAAVD